MSDFNENQETATILQIFLNYVNQNVFIENPATLERFSSQNPALCLKAEKGFDKGKSNILGEYIAIMPFGVALRIDANEEVQSAYQIFEELNEFFEKERANHHYPDLTLQRVCLDISMTSCPVLEKKNEDGSEEYVALFTIKYQKKLHHK